MNGGTAQHSTVVYRSRLQYRNRCETGRGDRTWEDCGDEGVQQVYAPVQQGLLAVRGMRPWCGAAVGVPSIRYLGGDVERE